MSVNEKMAAIADAIRGKTGGTEPLTLDQMATEIAGIQVGAGSGGCSGFEYANRLNKAFMYAEFPSGTELDIAFGSKVTSVHENISETFSFCFYRATGVRKIRFNKTPIYTSPYDMGYMFESYNASSTELEIVDLSGFPQPVTPKNFQKTFYMCTKLREVVGEFDFSGCTNVSNCFFRCDLLESVCFKPGTIKLALSFVSSPNLTDETIQNIIDGLADLSGGTAQTLTLHATVGAKLTDAQKAAASAKNWTISY